MRDEKLPLPDRKEADISLINAVAAAHALFGRLSEAGGLLRLANEIDPQHLRTLELISIVAIRRGQVTLAKNATDRFDKLSKVESEAVKIVQSRVQMQLRTEQHAFAVDRKLH